MRNMKQIYIRAGIFIVAVLLIAVGIRLALKGNATYEATQSNLHDIVAPHVTNSPFAKQGDFIIDNIHYFEGKDWVVADIKAVAVQKAEVDLVIFHKINGQYQLVSGPGSFFPRSSVLEFPKDVIAYMESIDAVGTTGLN